MPELSKNTVFVYVLLRDHLPIGVINQVMTEIESGVFVCTNEDLLAYAMKISDRLK